MYFPLYPVCVTIQVLCAYVYVASNFTKKGNSNKYKTISFCGKCCTEKRRVYLTYRYSIITTTLVCVLFVPPSLLGYSFLLTLSACARVAVVILWVCYRASCHIPCFKVPNEASCSFYHMYCVYFAEFRKCFTQKFWRHLLSTTAILTSRQALHWQKRQQGVLFNKTGE